MGKLKLGILGNGYLTDIIVETDLKGMLDKYELVGVLGKTREKTEPLARGGGCRACGTIDELLALAPDYVAEAASVQSVKDCGVKVLASGASMIVLSVGAFADKEFYGRVEETAAVRGARVYITSGAVGGFDVLRTTFLMEWAEAGIRTKKRPASLKGIPLSGGRLMEDTQESHVFHGNAKEAISLPPTKVNMAVTSFLATVGPENTRVNICSVPGMVGDNHKITSGVEGVKAVMDIYPSTSVIAGWNVVTVLRNIVSPIVF